MTPDGRTPSLHFPTKFAFTPITNQNFVRKQILVQNGLNGFLNELGAFVRRNTDGNVHLSDSPYFENTT
ncbi:hypothetical protein GGQ07_003141 [Salinibacter ruber]|nr:hypothetical protein [Salinibacter ruber]